MPLSLNIAAASARPASSNFLHGNALLPPQQRTRSALLFPRLHIVAAFFRTSSSFSALQSPNNPASNGPTTIQELLKSTLGMSDGELSILHRRDAYILKSGSAMRAEAAIQLLKSFGVSDSQLRMLCLRSPRFLVSRAQENMRPKLEALQSLGFTGEALGHVLCKGRRIIFVADLPGRIRRLDAAVGASCNLGKLVSRWPNILNYNAEQVERRVRLLKQSGIADEAFGRLVFSSSNVLKGCPDRFERAVDYLKKIGITATCKSFSKALVGIARCSGSCEDRAEALAIAGFSEAQIMEFFAKQPQLLAMSCEMLHRKIRFLVKSAGVSLHTIVKNPALLGYSLERRIRPRLAVFQFLSASPPSVKLPSLQTFILMGERALLEKYVSGNPAESELIDIMKRARQGRC